MSEVQMAVLMYYLSHVERENNATEAAPVASILNQEYFQAIVSNQDGIKTITKQDFLHL